MAAGAVCLVWGCSQGCHLVLCPGVVEKSPPTLPTGQRAGSRREEPPGVRREESQGAGCRRNWGLGGRRAWSSSPHWGKVATWRALGAKPELDPQLSQACSPAETAKF